MEALQTVIESRPSLSLFGKIEEEKKSYEVPSTSQMYSQMTNYEKVRIILKRKPEERTDEELELLLPLIKQIQFFKERDFNEDQIREIGSYLRYQKFKAGEDVVVYGQIGNKFYIMLDGEVSVNLPKTPEVAAKLEAMSSMNKRRGFKHHIQEISQQPSIMKSIYPTSPEPTEENPQSQKPSKIQSHLSSSVMTPVRSSIINTLPPTKSVDSLVEKVEDEHSKEIERLTKLAYDDNIQIKYIQVASLTSGASFGELALIKNKPRAATIRCLVDCEFAIVERSDYKRVIGRLERAKMDKIVDFLSSLPYFINWTRHTVAKLHYFFTKKVIKRGQHLFSEGDIAEHAYLIMDGEFEAFKIVTKLERKELDLEKILEHSHEQKARLFKGAMESQRRFHARVALKANGINKNQQKIKIAQMMHGQMMGEEDIIRSIANELPISRRYNIQCISASGTLLVIKKQDFLRKFKQREDTWNLILKSCKIKDTQFSLKIENEVQIKVHHELQMIPQIDRKRREESTSPRRKQEISKLRDCVVNYNFPQEQYNEEYMKRRKGPLRERLSSAKRVGGSLKASSSSLHHKRMLNLNNLNILLKKEEKLSSAKPSRHSVRSSVQTKRKQINEQLFTNQQDSGEVEHSLQIALMCQKEPDSMTVIEKAIEQGPIQKSRTIHSFLKLGSQMVETPTDLQKVFEKESPFLAPVRSEEEMKKKYSINFLPSHSSNSLKNSMVVVTKPLNQSNQMSSFKPSQWYKYYGHYQKKVKEMELKQKNQEIFNKKLNLKPTETQPKTETSSREGMLPFLERLKTEDFTMTSHSNLRTTALSPLHQTEATQQYIKQRPSFRSSRQSTKNLSQKRSSMDLLQYRLLKERGYMPQACTFLGKTQLIAKNSPKAKEGGRSFMSPMNDPSF